MPHAAVGICSDASDCIVVVVERRLCSDCVDAGLIAVLLRSAVVSTFDLTPEKHRTAESDEVHSVVIAWLLELSNELRCSVAAC